MAAFIPMVRLIFNIVHNWRAMDKGNDRVSRGLLMVFLVVAACQVSAETIPLKPLQLLQNMQTAMASLNYEGTVAILKNAQLDTLRYFHSVQKGVEQERLLSLNSPLREVIRDNDKVSCLFKASQQIIVDHKPVNRSFLLDLPKALPALAATYEFVIEEDAQVALQAVDVLMLKPLDQYRYARKFSIAKQTHLPLKIEVQDFTGETLEQVIFTELRVVEPLHKAAVDLGDKKIHHIHEFENIGLDNLSVNLKNLPTGFEQRQFTRVHLHPSSKAVEQLLLSDGLSSVSVYLEKSPQNSHAGLQFAGAVNSLTRVLGDLSITVMGDVPAATVAFIAEGISLPESDKE